MAENIFKPPQFSNVTPVNPFGAERLYEGVGKVAWNPNTFSTDVFGTNPTDEVLQNVAVPTVGGGTTLVDLTNPAVSQGAGSSLVVSGDGTSGSDYIEGGQGISNNMQDLGWALYNNPLADYSLIGKGAELVGGAILDNQIDKIDDSINTLNSGPTDWSNPDSVIQVSDAQGNVKTTTVGQYEAANALAQNEASDNDTWVSPQFGTKAEAEAVVNDGWGSEAHFDAIDDQFEDDSPSHPNWNEQHATISDFTSALSGETTWGGKAIDSSGNYDDSSHAPSTGGSVVTDSSGNAVTTSSGAPVYSAPAPSSGGGDSGGGDSGGGGRWCCSVMVHEGRWSEKREFARMTSWSLRKFGTKNNWWLPGYARWGKWVAKNIVAKTDWGKGLMQAFYDYHVEGKPYSIKTLAAQAIIFSGAFVAGKLNKHVDLGSPRLANREELYDS